MSTYAGAGSGAGAGAGAEKAVDTGDLKPPATTNVLPMTAHPG